MVFNDLLGRAAAGAAAAARGLARLPPFPGRAARRRSHGPGPQPRRIRAGPRHAAGAGARIRRGRQRAGLFPRHHGQRSALPYQRQLAWGGGIQHRHPLACFLAGGGSGCATTAGAGCTAAIFGWAGSRPGTCSRRGRSPPTTATTSGEKGQWFPIPQPSQFTDKGSTVHLFGPALALTQYAGAFSGRLDLQATLDFGMINSLAYNAYSAGHDVWGVKSTLHNWGYYYSLGYSLEGRLRSAIPGPARRGRASITSVFIPSRGLTASRTISSTIPA